MNIEEVEQRIVVEDGPVSVQYVGYLVFREDGSIDTFVSLEGFTTQYRAFFFKVDGNTYFSREDAKEEVYHHLDLAMLANQVADVMGTNIVDDYLEVLKMLESGEIDLPNMGEFGNMTMPNTQHPKFSLN